MTHNISTLHTLYPLTSHPNLDLLPVTNDNLREAGLTVDIQLLLL